MKVLAIDTSSNVASVAILEDDKLLGESILNHKKTHSQTIMPMIEELLKNCEIEIDDIDIFATVNGPGSFTGLRIGVATMKALAHATNKPIVGISSVEAMAYNVGYSNHVLCPIMDARRNQVYNGLYRWSGDYFIEIVPPRALSMEECLEDLKNYSDSIVFMGDGVPVHREYIKANLGERAIFASAPFANQRASSVAQLGFEKAMRGETESYIEFMPFYLRKPQAEREYEEKHQEEIK